MKKYENFKAALKNLKDIYDYEEPYNNVVLTGLAALYEICFEQSWKAMKELLVNEGVSEAATGSPKSILKAAYKAGLIDDEQQRHCPANSARYQGKILRYVLPFGRSAGNQNLISNEKIYRHIKNASVPGKGWDAFCAVCNWFKLRFVNFARYSLAKFTLP